MEPGPGFEPGINGFLTFVLDLLQPAALDLSATPAHYSFNVRLIKNTLARYFNKLLRCVGKGDLGAVAQPGRAAVSTRVL